MPKNGQIIIPYSEARLSALLLAVPTFYEDIVELVNKTYDKKVRPEVQQLVSVLEGQEDSTTPAKAKSKTKEAVHADQAT